MNLRKLICPERALIVAMLIASQAANADTLVLKNGDRITGEISKIWDAEITIEPEYSDEFKVDVSAVDHIESERDFEIELADGREIVGQPMGVDSNGNQLILVAEETYAVPLATLFELLEPEEDFDWESNVDFSGSLNTGNTESYNSKLRADTRVTIPGHRHLGELTFFKEHIAGTTTQEQDLFTYDYNWLFRDPLFFSSRLSFERNPITFLDHRVIVSFGFGRDIFNRPRKTLSLQVGVGGQTEKIGDVTTESTVATWSLRYRHDFFGDDLELFHNNSITHNLSGRTNTSYKTSTGVRYEITDLLYSSLSVDFDYETDPVDLTENEDVSILVGLGLEF